MYSPLNKENYGMLEIAPGNAKQTQKFDNTSFST